MLALLFFLLLCILINNIEQGGSQMQCQCDQLVPGPGEVSNAVDQQTSKSRFLFLDICPATERSVECVDELTIKDYLLD